jgi:serine/threonine protein kinase
MGSVFLALDTVLEREVAIKTISSTIRESHLKERFIREAKAAGKLRHNNIVIIYDFGIEEEKLFIVMEYLEGMDLYQLISQRTPMDIKQKLEIVRQICLGLDYAHQNEVFHRDIKPANVRLQKDGTVKIVDFGLAVMQTSSLTQSGAFLGTPNYVAPERLHGKSGDGRSDQFAVGILLYELLTYSKAFTGDNISRVMFSVLNDSPKGLDAKIVSDYPELESIIKRAIAKDPEQRYFNMKEMADDLELLIRRMRDNKFMTMDAIPLVNGEMPTQPESIYTDELIKTELTDVGQVTKKRSNVGWYVAGGMIAALLVIYFFFMMPGNKKEADLPGKQEPPPVTLSRTGFLTFNVTPYAIIKELIDVKTGKPVPQDRLGESLTTPIRLELTPGQYKMIYTHPQWQGRKQEKVVTVIAGETVAITDWLDKNFARDAANHFRVPLPKLEHQEN